MAAIATSRSTVDHDKSVERRRTAPPVETVRPADPERDTLDDPGSQSPLRGIMLAAPIGAGLWALIIGLVRVALP